MLFFLTGKTILESIRHLPLNKNTECNQNMFSNKLGAMFVYKFKMIIKLPIRWLGCPPATVHPYHKAWTRDQPELMSTRLYPKWGTRTIRSIKFWRYEQFRMKTPQAWDPVSTLYPALWERWRPWSRLAISS